MATSSVSGSGSMIDVQGIVSKLMVIEQRPLVTLNDRLAAVNVSISGMSELAGKVDAAYSAVSSLEDLPRVATKSLSNTDQTVVKASIISESSAEISSVRVSVNRLASSQVTTLKGFPDSDTTQLGEQSIQIGFPAASSLLGESDDQFVRIDMFGKTLSELRDEINSHSSLRGKVQATVVFSGGQDKYILVLKGTSSGEDNAFSVGVENFGETTVEVVDENGDYQSQIAFTGFLNSQGEVISNRVSSSAAKDASIELDGVTVSRPTNVFEDVVQGLRLEVTKAQSLGEAPAIISVARNVDGIVERMKSFAAAMTALVKGTRDLTKPGSENTKAGPLSGNSGVLSFLGATLSSYSTGFTFNSADVTFVDKAGRSLGTKQAPVTWNLVGVEMSRDGTLSVNESTLRQAVIGPLGDAMFSGFSSSIKSTLKSFQGISGSLGISVQSMKTNVTELGRQRSDLQDRIDRRRQALLNQYAQLDSRLVQMNQQRSGISAALSGL